LFDLERDPGECYDLGARHPEVVKELNELMEKFEGSLNLQDADDREWWKGSTLGDAAGWNVQKV
jgi:hypothetical protein